jgi:NAD(P)H-flavin reductase
MHNGCQNNAARQPGDFTIVQKRPLAPNVHELVVSAPRIARAARAGQFVILMPDEKSERVPMTLSDWDAAAGTVTLVVLDVGRASGQLARKEQGERLAHLVGPLGVPLEIDRCGTVALAAGCYGLGAVVCIAKAFKAAGNRVVVVAEARSHYLHYYAGKLREAADELVQTTVDGSQGLKGHAVDVLEQRLRGGEKLDRVIAVGCPFMMMLTARATEPFGVRTLAALNPIMVDGTGMCGACRVTVGGQTRFACVHGPFFDAHLVDWDELFSRAALYSTQEVRSLDQTEPLAARAEDGRAP